MSKNQDNSLKEQSSANGRPRASLPKLIFVGENKFQAKLAEQFAIKNQFLFMSYHEEEWATLEEIDQYIQDEELSKQVVNLPIGKRTISSLEDLEAETIKRVVKNVNGNMIKAARALKIARATLYRKLEKYGLNLKKQREESLKKQKESLKSAA